MRPPRKAVHVLPRLRCVSMGLAAVLVLHGSPSSAAPAPDDPWTAYGAHLHEAEQAIDAGRIHDAVRGYAAAYHALPARDRAGHFGGDVVDHVLALFDSEPTRDPEALRAALALLELHLEDARRANPAGDVQRLREHGDALAAELAVGEREAPTPASASIERPKPSTILPAAAQRSRPAASSPAPSREEMSDVPRPRPVHVALLASGVTGLAAGIALLAGGGGLQRKIHTAHAAGLDDCPLPRCQEVWDDWRDRNTRRRDGLFAAGGTLAALGLAAVVWASVGHRRARAQRRMVFLPAPVLGVAGTF